MELNNKVTALKYLLKAFSSRLDHMEKEINELEDRHDVF